MPRKLHISRLMFNVSCFYFFSFLALLVFLPIFIILIFGTKKIFYKSMSLLCVILVRFSSIFLGFKYDIQGELPKKRCIIAPQHQSNWDSVVLCSIFPPSAFVLKSCLRKNLLMRLIIWKLDMIPVNNRKRNSSQFNMLLEKTKKVLKNKFHLIIYPEGSREMKRVKLRRGVAFLHKYLNTMVVPIQLKTGYCWPKGWLKFPGIITVKIKEPIKKKEPHLLIQHLENIYYE